MPEEKSFWATVPGILTGIAAVIGALASLYIAIHTPSKDKTPPTQEVVGSQRSSLPQEAVRSRESPLPQLTMGAWTLDKAVDNDKYSFDWSGSTLKFTSQVETKDGLALKGFFEWRIGGVLCGTEDFQGNYVRSSHQVFFDGYDVHQTNQCADTRSIVQGSYPPVRIGQGHYSAVLSDDMRVLHDGTWGNVERQEPIAIGHWQATR